MLCEPKTRICLLGSSMLAGVLIGFLFVPRFADIYGRKIPLIATMVLTFCVQIALLFCESLSHAIFLMCFIGMTFPGKIIVGYNYLLEFTLDEYR